jgi:dTDP-4-dehydrorhamnose 3,5-epimerase-like enzyme
MKPTPKPAFIIPKLIEFPIMGSATTGLLTPVKSTLMPFEVQTLYWVYGATDTSQRGNHAHKVAEQVVFALQGTIKFVLEDVQGNSFEFILDKPHIGLYIPKMYWRTYELTPNSILVCLTSMIYTEEDYIRNYTDFRTVAKID